MKFLQINTDRRRAAIDLAFQSATNLGVDVILISEPNRAAARRNKGWYTDIREDSCIVRCNPKVEVQEWGKGRGFVWIRTGGLVVYSVYISPNVDEEVYEAFLADLQRSTQGKGTRMIIGGDFNAKSPLWGSATEDRKGGVLAEWAFSGGLIPVNTGGAPTFQRGTSSSVIDVTWATEATYRKFTNWSVLEEERGSLHRYIRFDVDDGRIRPARKWSGAKLSIERHQASIDARDPSDITNVRSLVRYLKQSQVEFTVSAPTDVGGSDVYWWTEEIGALRSVVVAKRRRFTRTSCRGDTNVEALEALRAEYKAAKEALKKAIAASKARCWSNLCTELENDTWGEGFRIVMRSLRLKNPRVDIDRTRRIDIVDAVFPREKRRAWDGAGGEPPTPDKITREEITRAADRLKSNRAPGLDGILPETIKIFVKSHGMFIAGLLDKLLREGRFPLPWKRTSLVLFPKPGKDTNEASGFRPICLLDTMGKLFEAVILDRLQEELRRQAPLYDSQHGFRKGRSAVDAIHNVLSSVRVQTSSEL